MKLKAYSLDNNYIVDSDGNRYNAEEYSFGTSVEEILSQSPYMGCELTNRGYALKLNVQALPENLCIWEPETFDDIAFLEQFSKELTGSKGILIVEKETPVTELVSSNICEGFVFLEELYDGRLPQDVLASLSFVERKKRKLMGWFVSKLALNEGIPINLVSYTNPERSLFVLFRLFNVEEDPEKAAEEGCEYAKIYNTMEDLVEGFKRECGV